MYFMTKRMVAYTIIFQFISFLISIILINYFGSWLFLVHVFFVVLSFWYCVRNYKREVNCDGIPFVKLYFLVLSLVIVFIPMLHGKFSVYIFMVSFSCFFSLLEGLLARSGVRRNS